VELSAIPRRHTFWQPDAPANGTAIGPRKRHAPIAIRIPGRTALAAPPFVAGRRGRLRPVRDCERTVARGHFKPVHGRIVPDVADRRRTGRRRAQRFWTPIPHAYRMHVQREFLISSAASDLYVCWAGRAHAAASTRIEAIAPSRRAARGQQRSPHEIIKDCRPGCRRLAGRRHRGGARVDQRSGSSRPDRVRGGR
jgi:hypothetical protein